MTAQSRRVPLAGCEATTIFCAVWLIIQLFHTGSFERAGTIFRLVAQILPDAHLWAISLALLLAIWSYGFVIKRPVARGAALILLLPSWVLLAGSRLAMNPYSVGSGFALGCLLSTVWAVALLAGRAHRYE